MGSGSGPPALESLRVDSGRWGRDPELSGGGGGVCRKGKKNHINTGGATRGALPSSIPWPQLVERRFAVFWMQKRYGGVVFFHAQTQQKQSIHTIKTKTKPKGRGTISPFISPLGLVNWTAPFLMVRFGLVGIGAERFTFRD